MIKSITLQPTQRHRLTRNKMKLHFPLALCFLLIGIQQGSSQRLMEHLDRGLVAVRDAGGKVFISWRLLGTEPNDLAFNVYRSLGSGRPEKLNRQPITKTTNFVDVLNDTSKVRTYVVKPVTRGKEGKQSKPFTLKAGSLPYLSLPLQTSASLLTNHQ